MISTAKSQIIYFCYVNLGSMLVDLQRRRWDGMTVCTHHILETQSVSNTNTYTEHPATPFRGATPRPCPRPASPLLCRLCRAAAARLHLPVDPEPAPPAGRQRGGVQLPLQAGEPLPRLQLPGGAGRQLGGGPGRGLPPLRAARLRPEQFGPAVRPGLGHLQAGVQRGLRRPHHWRQLTRIQLLQANPHNHHF